ncbi:DUF732 domain-containing protein [Mycobacterium sp. ITM-2016-00317]|uniref:DUF732 domain-containing protein n=1 Tax=Mycobacterium sp. ITM-2016-00317 TaxID=2099694 RepID=UPI00287FEC2C|nr:DUF732 domain-containing protein [Mycobacterium sp. ITM-2016-00317]WNG85333.1 DUF732 domain-containing protein [Mycobacterium sp. ITM-2016-00317]
MAKVTSAAIVGVMASAVAAAPVAHADPDTAFAAQLHTYGIYGQKDYNAWIAKIMCKRLRTGLDADPFKSAEFVHAQLNTGTTTEQAWQFVGGAVNTYCPEQIEGLRLATQ